MRVLFSILLTVVVFLWGQALAEPTVIREASGLQREAGKAVCSLNGFFCAVMDPEQKVTTVVRRRAGGVSQPLWSMDGWFRVAYVSNDGEYLVTGYDGVNLLPLNYKRNQVMISFYDRGKLIRQVRLNEMISDFSKLEKVASHYRWGECLGLNSEDHLTVELVDKTWLMFDIKTGQIIR